MFFVFKELQDYDVFASKTDDDEKSLRFHYRWQKI
jgi:hypothetical protein